MPKDNCMNCKKELTCSCFDIDLDEHHAPFCSEKCLTEWCMKNSNDIIDYAENFSYDPERGWHTITYKGHFAFCENQFDVEDSELKKLIKELQESKKNWEKLALNYNKEWKQAKKEMFDKFAKYSDLQVALREISKEFAY